MNESTFIGIHNVASSATINAPQRININFDVPNASNPTVGIVSSFTATLSDSNGNDIESILTQAEKVNMVLSYDGGRSSTLDLEINSIQKSKGGNGIFYIYFKVKPFTFNTADLTGIGNKLQNIKVNFSPIISSTKFLISDYNAIFSNAIENRSSKDRQVATRNLLDINPSNSSSLFAGTATKAQIPDSNYTDTGIVNSRYEGSLTTSNDFGGTDPALTGRVFIGEVFSDETPDGVISGSNDRVIEELFHTSPTQLPKFSVVSSSYEVSSNNITDVTQTSFGYRVNPSAVRSEINVLNANNVIVIGSEKLRILQNNTTTSTLTVERGYAGTTAANNSTGDDIFIIQPTRIFKFNDRGSQIVVSNNTKIFVKDSNEILSTDKFGTVFTSASLN
tara:strand:- start:1472 stop:2647 length:1176 start_codon:yes stop_codon:yes gene_type:complete